MLNMGAFLKGDVDNGCFKMVLCERLPSMRYVH